MKLLAWLTEAFIAIFGITRPKPEQERMARLLIGGFLLGFILFAGGLLTLFLLFEINRGAAH